MWRTIEQSSADEQVNQYARRRWPTIVHTRWLLRRCGAETACEMRSFGHVTIISNTRATRDRKPVVDRLPRASVAALAKWPSIDDDKDLGA